MALSEPKPPFPDWPRYAPERALPPYHYVPGLNAHPISDPAGHSHGHPPERPPVPAPQEWSLSPAYRYGVDLHNFAYWWEAHECWEGIWQGTGKRDPQAQFLQGLIQVSAGMLKNHLGHPVGAATLLTEAEGRLKPVARDHPRYMGVDLRDYLGKVAACLEDLKAGNPLVAERLPMIRLS